MTIIKKKKKEKKKEEEEEEDRLTGWKWNLTESLSET